MLRRRVSDGTFRMACESLSRVMIETSQFHSTLANNAYDALALEDALNMEKLESGKLAYFLMQMETLGLATSKRVKGLVLVGPKGSGKQLAIDQVLLQHEQHELHPCTKRQTYTEFMGESIPALLQFRNDSSNPYRDPIPYLVHDIAKTKGIQLLIVEDFAVTSLVEAMLLRRIFKGLFGYGLGIVLTTARPPSHWYAHGVNAHKLDGFRALIQQECEMMRMDE